MSELFRSFKDLIWSWILRNVFGYTGGGQNRVAFDEPRPLRVFVKTSSNRTIPLTLEQNWTVGEIKGQLAAILNLEDSSNLAIILAGRELSNDVKVCDCDLGQQTILHAVQVVQKSTPKPPLNEDLVDLQLTGEERQLDEENATSTKAHFYVYCKDCPKTLQTGKLRVRCHRCQEGSILIHRDPCGWSDVLDQPGRIMGHCLSGKCSSDGNEDSQAVPAEFYFKCTNGNQDHLAPPLYQIRANINSIPCLACTESLDTVLVFECEDRHVICLQCFGVYAKGRLNERQMIADPDLGYTIGCPIGCLGSLISQHKHILVMFEEPEEYDRYHRFATEECLLQAGGVLCPQPGCGAGILPDNPGERKIKCVQCSYVFCKNCHQGYHEDEDCETEEAFESLTTNQNLQATVVSNPEMALQARWQEQSSIAIKVMTKPCPKCRSPTERDGGCMHMECTRCNFDWCWICQSKWTRECMASHWFT